MTFNIAILVRKKQASPFQSCQLMLFAEGTGSFGQNADASAAMAATFLTAGGFHQLGKTLKAELPPVD